MESALYVKKGNSSPAAGKTSSHYTGLIAIGSSIILCAGGVQCPQGSEHSGSDTLGNLW